MTCRSGLRVLQGPQRFEPVHPGHHDVEQHDVRRVAGLDGRQHFVPARERAGLVSAQREKRLQVPGKCRIVVDNGDVRLRQGITPQRERIRRWRHGMPDPHLRQAATRRGRHDAPARPGRLAAPGRGRRATRRTPQSAQQWRLVRDPPRAQSPRAPPEPRRRSCAGPPPPRFPRAARATPPSRSAVKAARSRVHVAVDARALRQTANAKLNATILRFMHILGQLAEHLE